MHVYYLIAKTWNVTKNLSFFLLFFLSYDFLAIKKKILNGPIAFLIMGF